MYRTPRQTVTLEAKRDPRNHPQIASEARGKEQYQIGHAVPQKGKWANGHATNKPRLGSEKPNEDDGAQRAVPEELSIKELTARYWRR